MNRDRVRVIEVPGVEIARWKGDVLLVACPDRHFVLFGVDVRDGGAGAVRNTEFAVVAEADDLVTGLKRPAICLEFGAGEGAVRGEVLAGALVEVVDVVVPFCDHDGVVARDVTGVPVCGYLIADALGYYALVPESQRVPNTKWRPTVEAAALGIAAADYGIDNVALLGPSAARLHDCYPRALAAAVVATPKQRPMKETLAGTIKFVIRDVTTIDVVRANTELTAGWMTSVEQTLLDLSDNWPRWPVSETARNEMLRLLSARASWEELEALAKDARGGAAFDRLKQMLDDPR